MRGNPNLRNPQKEEIKEKRKQIAAKGSKTHELNCFRKKLRIIRN